MRDYTLPGYKYLGPGNKLNKGPPVNEDDYVALLHDYQYDRLIKRGLHPYYKYSAADEEARQKFSYHTYGGLAGKAFFTFKKLAYKAGLIGHVNDATMEPKTAGKRLRGAASDFFPSKRLRFDGGPVPGVSVSKLPGGAQASSVSMEAGGGSGTEAGLKETPIDDVFNVSRGPPDFTFATLPFVEEYGFNGNTTDYYAVDNYYRLTSPYDTTRTRLAQDSNVGAGTTTRIQRQRIHPRKRHGGSTFMRASTTTTTWLRVAGMSKSRTTAMSRFTLIACISTTMCHRKRRRTKTCSCGKASCSGTSTKWRTRLLPLS